MQALVTAIRIFLVFIGVCMLLLILTIAALIILWPAPERLAVQKRGNGLVQIITPQPLQVTPADTNVLIVEPPAEAYLSGAATNVAVWANGKPFRTRGEAAWEMVRGAWRFWLVSAGAILGQLLWTHWQRARRR